jgi:hypothetical protein
MGGMSTMALAGVQFLFIGATFGAMYAWLAPSGLATWARVLASLLVALLFTVALIALHDIARRRAKIRSVRQPELMDGRAVVLVGHIVTVGQTMTAPFSGAECAASFFTASVTGARGARSVILDGYSIAPCVFRTSLGDLRLNDYPPTTHQAFLADPDKAPAVFARAASLRAARGARLATTGTRFAKCGFTT